MVSLDEEVKDFKVHVFKWNEKLHNVHGSQGLFMFSINNASKKPTPQIEHRGGDPKIYTTFLFELENLSTPDSTEYLVSHAIEGRQFYFEDTAVRLRKEVSAYLLSCFKFDIETLYQKPTIVVVVDVYISRTMRYARKRFAPSPFSWSDKQVVKKQKRLQDDDSKGLKHSSQCVAGKLSAEEVQDIRDMLMSDLEEPISSQECQGLYEVEVAMNVKVFDGDDDDDNDDVCSICFEGIWGGMMIAITPCSHMFHRDCLFKWLPKTSRCPFCRSICATVV